MADKSNLPNRKNPLEQDNNPGEYVFKTVRSAAVTAVIVAAGMATKGKYDLIAPFLIGTGLGCALMVAWERFATALITPKAAREKKNNRRWLVGLFALVKYPLVAYLIYWITRHWEQTQILSFVGGFILFQAIIVLRALGRILMESPTNYRSSKILPAKLKENSVAADRYAK
jgi:hypothetical protein